MGVAIQEGHGKTASTFVLIHGAFHGGWCWRATAQILRAEGSPVYCPTLSGLAERRHLLPHIAGFETFVLDVANLLFYEDLQDVVLVGHSFGARVAIAVADRAPERLRKLVLLDGGIALRGESRLDAMPEAERRARIERAHAHDGGISIPPPAPEQFGVRDPAEQAWLAARLTPQPLSVEATGCRLAHEIGNQLPVTYVRCTEPPFPGVEVSAQYARQRPDWRYAELAAGHDAMVSHPRQLAQLLLQDAI